MLMALLIDIPLNQFSHPAPPPTHTQVASAPQGQGDTEATLSRDEKLRRERQRAYAVGVTAYAWAGPSGGRILVPMQVGGWIGGWMGGWTEFNHIHVHLCMHCLLPPTHTRTSRRQGSLYVQEGVGNGGEGEEPRPLRLVYDAKGPRRGPGGGEDIRPR